MNVAPVGLSGRPTITPLSARGRAAGSEGAAALSNSASPSASSFATQLESLAPGPGPASRPPADQKLRETFDSVVGQTLFAQMLRSMRKTVRKPAYFHGGRAEEVFQQQLDEVLAEKISQASASRFTEPMYELFTLSRK